MKCPNCKDINLIMADRQGIEIDYCPECRGVWLDRGELDKIIERSMHQMPQSRGDEAYQDRSRRLDKGDNPHKKKKSFLGELLDF